MTYRSCIFLFLCVQFFVTSSIGGMPSPIIRCENIFSKEVALSELSSTFLKRSQELPKKSVLDVSSEEDARKLLNEMGIFQTKEFVETLLILAFPDQGELPHTWVYRDRTIPLSKALKRSQEDPKWVVDFFKQFQKQIISRMDFSGDIAAEIHLNNILDLQKRAENSIRGKWLEKAIRTESQRTMIGWLRTKEVTNWDQLRGTVLRSYQTDQVRIFASVMFLLSAFGVSYFAENMQNGHLISSSLARPLSWTFLSLFIYLPMLNDQFYQKLNPFHWFSLWKAKVSGQTQALNSIRPFYQRFENDPPYEPWSKWQHLVTGPDMNRKFPVEMRECPLSICSLSKYQIHNLGLIEFEGMLSEVPPSSLNFVQNAEFYSAVYFQPYFDSVDQLKRHPNTLATQVQFLQTMSELKNTLRDILSLKNPDAFQRKRDLLLKFLHSRNQEFYKKIGLEKNAENVEKYLLLKEVLDNQLQDLQGLQLKVQALYDLAALIAPRAQELNGLLQGQNQSSDWISVAEQADQILRQLQGDFNSILKRH